VMTSIAMPILMHHWSSFLINYVLSLTNADASIKVPCGRGPVKPVFYSAIC
jgi:hypothetical protein